MKNFPLKVFMAHYFNVEENMLFPETCDPLQQAKEYWSLIEMTFREFERMKAFDALKDARARKRYVIEAQSKVIGVTSQYLKSKFEKLRQGEF